MLLYAYLLFVIFLRFKRLYSVCPIVYHRWKGEFPTFPKKLSDSQSDKCMGRKDDSSGEKQKQINKCGLGASAVSRSGMFSR